MKHSHNTGKTALNVNGFNVKAFRDKLKENRIYTIRAVTGKDDRFCEFVKAKLIKKYDTYAQFAYHGYMECVLYFDLANGGMK